MKDMSNSMKLGTQTGSLMNHLYSRGQEQEPVVGEGATVLLWTDRHAYTVREYDPKKKTVVIERCDPVRTDSYGMSDSQSYDYSKHTGKKTTLYYKWGAWRTKQISYVLKAEKNVEFADFKYREQLRKSGVMDKITDENGRFIESEYTERKVTYHKINIVFGFRKEYYDFSF